MPLSPINSPYTFASNHRFHRVDRVSPCGISGFTPWDPRNNLLAENVIVEQVEIPILDALALLSELHLHRERSSQRLPQFGDGGGLKPLSAIENSTRRRVSQFNAASAPSPSGIDAALATLRNSARYHKVAAAETTSPARAQALARNVHSSPAELSK